MRPLQITVKFIRLVKWLLDNYKTFRDIGIDYDATSFGKPEIISNTYNQLVQTSMMATIESMALTDFENNPYSIQICNEYFSLAKIPYVHNFLREVIHNPLKSSMLYWSVTEPIKLSKAKIEKELPALEQILAQKYSDWQKKTSRTLRQLNAAPELGSSDNAIFNSDVHFMTPKDTNDTVLVEAKWDPSGKEHKPMNLSMIFP